MARISSLSLAATLFVAITLPALGKRTVSIQGKSHKREGQQTLDTDSASESLNLTIAGMSGALEMSRPIFGRNTDRSGECDGARYRKCSMWSLTWWRSLNIEQKEAKADARCAWPECAKCNGRTLGFTTIALFSGVLAVIQTSPHAVVIRNQWMIGQQMSRSLTRWKNRKSWMKLKGMLMTIL
jgi:hypothetical protein